MLVSQPEFRRARFSAHTRRAPRLLHPLEWDPRFQYSEFPHTQHPCMPGSRTSKEKRYGRIQLREMRPKPSADRSLQTQNSALHTWPHSVDTEPCPSCEHEIACPAC